MLADRYGPWGLIVGGSEGVGVSFARSLAAEGMNLMLLARKPGPLEETAQAIRNEHGVQAHTLSVDLADPDGALAQVRAITDPLEIGMLVYNAGTDNVAADYLDRPFEAARRTIGLNVLGQALFAHHFGGEMRRRGRGGIILVGSLLAYAGGGAMSIYAATKSFSHVFAKGLWYELKPHGVDVLGLVLSATRTPAAERLGLRMDHPEFPPSDPDIVTAEGLEQLGRVPLWVVRDAQPFATYLRSLSDEEAVNLVGQTAAEMHGPRPGHLKARH
jgi:short-subunit dehydrogenase